MSPSDARVLVTPRSFGRDDPAVGGELAAAVAEVTWAQGGDLGPAELRELVAEADGWIAGVEPIDRALIEAAPRLKVIARYGTGTDNVDLAAAADHGVVVANTPGANAAAVAELVIGLVFALARGIPAADRAVRNGAWPRAEGMTVAGRTLGLLGLGAIGSEVAWRARALGFEVVAHDPVPPVEFVERHGITLSGRDDMLAAADFLSLHLPLLDETRNAIDAAALARMKPGAFLVNAARGELVDETALLDALATGRLAGAALDALSEEPPAADHPLLASERVILTPHAGAHTDGARREMGRRAVENCVAVLRGLETPDAVPTPARRSPR